MTAPTIETPRSPQGRGRTGQRSNFELYSWLFMRISGLVLVFLVLGHLFIMNMLDGGVQRGGGARHVSGAAVREADVEREARVVPRRPHHPRRPAV